MSFEISNLVIVGEVNTIDLVDTGLSYSPCVGGIYSAMTMTNTTILSVNGSIVEYVVNSTGIFSFVGELDCGDGNGAIIQIIGNAVVFQATVSQASEPYTFLPCCNECNNPIIVTDIYEGDTYVPFSLDMEDGTEVATTSGDSGFVLNGVGVIELSAAVSAGDEIKLSVVSETCKATSSIYTVKTKSEDCDAPQQNRCHIRLLSVSVKQDGVNLASIKSLNVEAFGDLRYRIDNGEWFADWQDIGSFDSRINHKLGIKLALNPTCRIEYPFLAISYT